MSFSLEPDPEPRTSPHHKRILETKRIENTKTGNYARLECGHWVIMFGRLELAGGVAFCRECRDTARETNE
jgi:hypothetical protein